MDFKFTRSLVVMGQLAQDIARTPPHEDDPYLEYVDRSLAVVGRTFNGYDQKIRQEFLAQREFIASQSREVERRMDGRFEEVSCRFQELEKKMDERFEEVDRRFQKVDRRFDKLEGELRDLRVQVENAAAFTRNGRLRQMHQPINLIRVLKPTDDPNKFIWTSHPQVPKHMKSTYILGQRAKGIFESGWQGKTNQQSMYSVAGHVI